MNRSIHYWRIVGLAAAAMSVAGGGWAQNGVRSTEAAVAEATPLNLESALRIALTNNPELRAGSGRVDAAAGRADQAKLWSNPELELSTEEGPVSGGRVFSGAKQTLGVAQTVPYPGKKSLDRQIGGAGVKLSDAELAVLRLELTRDVKTAFFQVLAAERLVEVANELVRVAESSAATARKRVEAGAAADQELLRAEIGLVYLTNPTEGPMRKTDSQTSLLLALGFLAGRRRGSLQKRL